MSGYIRVQTLRGGIKYLGDVGPTGPEGPPNILTIGVVTEGKEAQATITGKSPNQILNLVLPKAGGVDDYKELLNLPTLNGVILIGDMTLKDLGIQPEGEYIEEEQDPTVPSYVKSIKEEDINNWNNKAEKEDIPDTSKFITNEVDNLVNYELKSNTGTNIALSIDQNTYVMTLQLKNTAGTVLSQKTIDLPLETMVIGATYEAGTLKLTLKNGQTVDVDITDIISGLVSDTRKIAGLDLKDDITKEELRVALEITSLITSALTNYYNKTEVDNLLSNKVAFTDYATSSKAGVMRPANGLFVTGTTGAVLIAKASNAQIDAKTDNYYPIVPSNLDYAVHSVVDSTIITEIDSDTLLLEHNQDARVGELATLILNMPAEIDERYESSFSFRSGETATTLTYSATPIKWQGDDCNASGEFIPEVNTSYEISIRKVNDTDIIARVGGY